MASGRVPADETGNGRNARDNDNDGETTMNEQQTNCLIDAEADARRLSDESALVAQRLRQVIALGNDPDIHDEVRALVPLAASVGVMWQMSRAFGMAGDVAR